MDILFEIYDKVKNDPRFEIQKSDNFVRLEPKSDTGFAIDVRVHKKATTVYFEGWHEEFTDPKEALDCVGFGLSSECRLKIIYKGTMPHKWVLEYLDDGKWLEESTVGLLFMPFWRISRIVYRQN